MYRDAWASPTLDGKIPSLVRIENNRDLFISILYHLYLNARNMLKIVFFSTKVKKFSSHVLKSMVFMVITWAPHKFCGIYGIFGRLRAITRPTIKCTHPCINIHMFYAYTRVCTGLSFEISFQFKAHVIFSLSMFSNIKYRCFHHFKMEHYIPYSLLWDSFSRYLETYLYWFNCTHIYYTRGIFFTYE